MQKIAVFDRERRKRSKKRKKLFAIIVLGLIGMFVASYVLVAAFSPR